MISLMWVLYNHANHRTRKSSEKRQTPSGLKNGWYYRHRELIFNGSRVYFYKLEVVYDGSDNHGILQLILMYLNCVCKNDW